ncbi:hypothetical protein Ancab_033557 [Ancistrocladus abbreviatus]
MVRYRYLVGVKDATTEWDLPSYRQRFKKTDHLITIAEIWKCEGRLLSSTAPRAFPSSKISVALVLFALIDLFDITMATLLAGNGLGIVTVPLYFRKLLCATFFTGGEVPSSPTS